MTRPTLKQWLWIVPGALVVILLLLQGVPYGHAHTNPPVSAEAPWRTPAVHELARRACYDCHSNTTRWPWYSYVAPISWLVQDDVDEARSKLNFTEWDRPHRRIAAAPDELSSGDMPPGDYCEMHSQANLTDAEKKQLIAELQWLGAPPPPPGAPTPATAPTPPAPAAKSAGGSAKH
ncbi:MAG: heme-binding domain-containing protein [Planctomycetota bacterium]